MSKSSLIEVQIGDVLDPARYNIVTKSDLKKLKPMETALNMTACRKLEKSELQVGKLVSVSHGEDWFRGKILDILTIFGAEIRLEVILIDYGVILKDVQFPQRIQKLPNLFTDTEPKSFEFKLKGKTFLNPD